MVSDKLVKEKNLNAVSIIKEIAGEINGGGGGQPFLATAGGKNPAGIQKALSKAACTDSENLNILRPILESISSCSKNILIDIFCNTSDYM